MGVRCSHSRRQADSVKMAANKVRYVSITQIRENVEVLFFRRPHHTEGYDTILVDARNPQLGNLEVTCSD